MQLEKNELHILVFDTSTSSTVASQDISTYSKVGVFVETELVEEIILDGK